MVNKTKLFFASLCLIFISSSFADINDDTYYEKQKDPIFRWVKFDELKKVKDFGFKDNFKTQVKGKLKEEIGSRYGRLKSLRFQDYPVKESRDLLLLKIVAYYSKSKRKGHFIKADVSFNTHLKIIEDLRITKFVPLSKTRFSVRTSLVQLKVILDDQTNGITILYPVGGPAFDMGVTDRSNGYNIFTTPTISGTINRSTLYERRTHPAYYKGKPWLRLIPTNSNWSLFGFHISPWTDHLERGHVSAGCLRLKEDDLYEFFTIAKYGGLRKIPFSVVYRIPEKDEHPYPKMKNEYETVYFARWTPSRDRERIRTKRVYRRPPIERLHEYRGFYWP